MWYFACYKCRILASLFRRGTWAILLQIVERAVITSSPPAWTSSAGMLSTPADFLFFNDCTTASNSLRGIGWSSSVCLGTVQYWTCDCTADSRILSIWSVSLVLVWSIFFWTILDSSSSQVVKSFTSLAVVFPEIFFNFTYLVFFRYFRFEYFISQFSPFIAKIKKFRSDPFFSFFPLQCLQRISLAVSVTAVLNVVIIELMPVSSLFMMVKRCKRSRLS